MIPNNPTTFNTILRCPVERLPTKLYQVVVSVQHRIQVHLELALILLLGVLAEVIQGVANVQIPMGPINSLNLWTLLLADSGEGKTPAQNLLRKAVTDFEKTQYIRYQQELEEYTIQHKLWKEIDKELSSQLRKAIRDGDDQTAPKAALAEHSKAKPTQPQRVMLTYSDTTIEAFLQGLCEKWPNASLVSDEASSYLKGSIANALPHLNQRWEIGPLDIERSSNNASMHADDPRVTLNWAMQPSPLKAFLEQKGQDARDLGTLARFIIACPPSMQGFRNANVREDDPKYLDWFYQRCTDLLKRSMTDDGKPLTQKLTVTFGHNATLQYAQLRTGIEEQIRPGGKLEHAKDYAAKVPRQIARLAAIIELFEHDSLIISPHSLDAATWLMDWFTTTYINTICSGPVAPQELQDADKLYQWLHQRACQYNNRYIVHNDVQKGCPRPLRNDTSRLGAALMVLQQRGQIVVCQFDVRVIDMNPQLMPDHVSLTNAITLYRSKRRGPKLTLP